MGITGLTTFIDRNDLYDFYCLHDTIVLIDGYNLVFQQYFHGQQKINDHMYGGDYTLLANNVRQFFQNLKRCNVKPIVVFDGTVDPSLEKLETILHRTQETLNNARKIYDNNFYIEGILPKFADSIYRLQLEQLDIFVFQTAYEADDTIIQIAFELQCPVLTNDSDFLSYNLAGGIIPLRSLFDYNCAVHHSSSYNFMKCRCFKITNLKRMYPKLNLNLVQTLGFILGNDYVNFQTVKSFIRKISFNKDKQRIINDVLKWLEQQNTLPSLLSTLSNLVNDPDKELVKLIEKHFLKLENYKNPESIDLKKYFDENMEKLFLQNVNIPNWIKESFAKKKIHRRLVSIYIVHMDWCRPLVEDFSYSQSSYDASINLIKYIYGLLRTRDKSVPNIKRFCRKNAQFRPEVIAPNFILNQKFLPKFNDIENLNIEQREKIFFQILNIDQEILFKINDLIENGLKGSGCKFQHSLLTEFKSMMLSLIFMMRNFDDHIWIEFIYAIFMNIWFSGNLCPESSPKFITIVDSNLRTKIRENLSKYSMLPVLSCSKTYMPRVVHFYNVFQNCIDNIHLLSSILNVKNLFDVGILLCSLKGTFIYNLTAQLSSRPKPLLYMQELFERQKYKAMDVFIKLLDFIMDQADRKLLAFDKKFDGDISPKSLLRKIQSNHQTNGSKPELYFVRGFEVTNKKTHINSQKMKLRK